MFAWMRKEPTPKVVSTVASLMMAIIFQLLFFCQLGMLMSRPSHRIPERTSLYANARNVLRIGKHNNRRKIAFQNKRADELDANKRIVM